MTKTTIKVKQETRKKLKLYAAEHGITMDEAINKLSQDNKDILSAHLYPQP